MEMINRAINDAAYAADFMRKIQGSNTSAHDEPHEELQEQYRLPGNRAERRAAEKAQRKADKANKVRP